MISKVSKKLQEKNIYHKIKKDRILTRRTKVKIPEINEDIAYLTGVIAGDGCLCISKRKRGGNHHTLRIHSNSKNHLNYLSNLFQKYFDIPGKIIKDKRKKNTYFVSIENVSIFWYFKILDAKYKWKNSIPTWCKKGEMFKQYMSGLIDSDGSVYNRRIQLKLKNELVIKQIYRLLKHANPNKPRINYTNKIPFYYIRFDHIFPLRLKGEQSFLN